MDEIENIIAESKMLFKKADGEVINCRVVIGKPYVHEKYDYACPINIEGFPDSKVRTLYGMDTLDALSKAYSILHTLFCVYQRDGQFFYHEVDGMVCETILPKDLYN